MNANKTSLAFFASILLAVLFAITTLASLLLAWKMYDGREDAKASLIDYQLKVNLVNNELDDYPICDDHRDEIEFPGAKTVWRVDECLELVNDELDTTKIKLQEKEEQLLTLQHKNDLEEDDRCDDVTVDLVSTKNELQLCQQELESLKKDPPSSHSMKKTTNKSSKKLVAKKRPVVPLALNDCKESCNVRIASEVEPLKQELERVSSDLDRTQELLSTEREANKKLEEDNTKKLEEIKSLRDKNIKLQQENSRLMRELNGDGIKDAQRIRGVPRHAELVGCALFPSAQPHGPPTAALM